MTVQEDQGEFLEDLSSGHIEEALARCNNLVGLYLPGEFGGQLERVVDLVDLRITGSEDAGFRVIRARKFFDEAQIAVDDERYQRAFINLCDAYNELRHMFRDDDDDDDDEGDRDS